MPWWFLTNRIIKEVDNDPVRVVLPQVPANEMTHQKPYRDVRSAKCFGAKLAKEGATRVVTGAKHLGHRASNSTAPGKRTSAFPIFGHNFFNKSYNETFMMFTVRSIVVEPIGRHRLRVPNLMLNKPKPRNMILRHPSLSLSRNLIQIQRLST